MTKIFKNVIMAISLLLIYSCSPSHENPMEGDWLFLQEDLNAAYEEDWEDSHWKKVSIPHDWAFENGYSERGAQGDRGGYADGGVAWYRKHFNLSTLGDHRFFLYFDAVYMNSEVWINGHYLGKRPYGYISFRYEITDWVHAGENILAVRVDNSLEPSARWYHGCGIYGEVRLERSAPVRIEENSLYVTTPQVSTQKAILDCSAKVDARDAKKKEGVTVSWTLLSPSGERIAEDEGKELSYLEEGFSLEIEHPQIWDLETPHLYTLCLELKKGKSVLDRKEVRVGLRSLSWETESGFHLNGRVVKLQGVCEHLEGGPVGAAWTKDLLRWKLQLLKEMGCNAIRTAHNPQLPFFYDLCDELGLLVMDECFDGWGVKAKYDYGMQAFSEWWEQDLRSFIRRDRNHPCVIIWSLGNETRGKIAENLVQVCHEEDPSRLVTSGHSSSEFMDVLGVNGNSEKKSFIENHRPEGKAFVGTETPHTWQVRGYYRSKTWYRDGYPNKKQDPFFIPDLTDEEIFQYEWAPMDRWTNAKQHFNSSYDNATVRLTARHNIQFLRDVPWYSGSFRWTGFDYLGEAGYVHGGWPFRAFMGGALDMAGFKKDLYYLYQAEWTKEPMVHLLPHWTHPYMKEGTEIPVLAYTNAEEVELIVNGESLGRKKKGRAWNEMACEWLVPWKEGKVEAIAYRDGKEVARTSQETSAQPTCLKLETEDVQVSSQEEKTLIMTVALEDDKEVLYPYGENRVYFQFEDGTRVLSIENGNPVDVETNWNADNKRTFFGLLRVFLTLPANKSKSSVYVGSILGDKRLKISPMVTIDIRKMDLLSGLSEKAEVEIRYTLDGSNPDHDSPLYTGSFPVKPETTVKAVAYLKGEKSIEMTEKFGPDEGLHWNTGIEKDFSLRGMQAEMLDWEGFEKKTDFQGFKGECYLRQKKEVAHLSFYQENDGTQKIVPLRIQYLHRTGHPIIEIFNNTKKVAVIDVDLTPSSNWDILECQVPLNRGANQIDIHFRNAKGNGIDWIELAE